MGTPEEWLQLMEAIAQVIKGQDIQDGDAAYSLNEEESQEVKDDVAVTKCLAAVTEHVFPKKAYKTQKSTSETSVLDRVTATKISCKEFVDVLEDRILYKWKLEFKKKGFNLSSSTLKEFLDVCVRLEEAELQKLLRKTIAHTKKEQDKDEKRKHQDKPKLHHERCHGSGKCHQAEKKKNYCNYH
eukprot:13982235-Ditylum_brightwellii.AAC.1